MYGVKSTTRVKELLLGRRPVVGFSVIVAAGSCPSFMVIAALATLLGILSSCL